MPKANTVARVWVVRCCSLAEGLERLGVGGLLLLPFFLSVYLFLGKPSCRISRTLSSLPLSLSIFFGTRAARRHFIHRLEQSLHRPDDALREATRCSRGTRGGRGSLAAVSRAAHLLLPEGTEQILFVGFRTAAMILSRAKLWCCCCCAIRRLGGGRTSKFESPLSSCAGPLYAHLPPPNVPSVHLVCRPCARPWPGGGKATPFVVKPSFPTSFPSCSALPSTQHQTHAEICIFSNLSVVV